MIPWFESRRPSQPSPLVVYDVYVALMTARLDAQGLKCPLPVLRARKALRDVSPGETLTVEVTDTAAPADFRAFCEQAGHEIVSSDEADGVYTIVIRRKG